MAKKKNEKISPFVPVEEQPYPVPGNWCWTYILDVSDVVTGSTPSKKRLDYYGGNFPLFKPTDLDAGRHVIIGSEYLTEAGKVVSRIIPANSTAVCCIGSIGKCGFLDIDGTTNQQINSLIPKFNPLYLFYYCNTEVFVNQLWQKASATTISIINKSKTETCFIPLAPLDEQQRIVNRIENLFAQLDEAKEKAKEALDSFEIRKKAILYEAFSGELTRKWRKENEISNLWQNVHVKEICSDIKVGIVIKPSQYYTDAASGTPAFRSANVREFHVDNFDWVYIDEKGQAENTRSIVHTGDVLIVRSGNPGTACIVTDEFDGYNAIDVLIAVPNRNHINPEFLCAFTNSPIAKQQISEGKRGMALAHFNVGGYSKLSISLPTLEEQTEIIRLLDVFFDQELQAKAQVESVLENINTMKKAILAKAFRGDLGTNNPEDESAEELLKRTLS